MSVATVDVRGLEIVAGRLRLAAASAEEAANIVRRVGVRTLSGPWKGQGRGACADALGNLLVMYANTHTHLKSAGDAVGTLADRVGNMQKRADLMQRRAGEVRWQLLASPIGPGAQTATDTLQRLERDTASLDGDLRQLLATTTKVLQNAQNGVGVADQMRFGAIPGVDRPAGYSTAEVERSKLVLAQTVHHLTTDPVGTLLSYGSPTAGTTWAILALWDAKVRKVFYLNEVFQRLDKISPAKRLLAAIAKGWHARAVQDRRLISNLTLSKSRVVRSIIPMASRLEGLGSRVVGSRLVEAFVNPNALAYMRGRYQRWKSVTKLLGTLHGRDVTLWWQKGTVTKNARRVINDLPSGSRRVLRGRELFRGKNIPLRSVPTRWTTGLKYGRHGLKAVKAVPIVGTAIDMAVWLGLPDSTASTLEEAGVTIVRSEGTIYMAREIGKAPVASVDVLRYARTHGLTIQYEGGRAYVIATLGNRGPDSDDVWNFRDEAVRAREILEGRGRRPAAPRVA